MARVKTAMITRKKHKKVLKRAKGYYGAKGYRHGQRRFSAYAGSASRTIQQHEARRCYR